MEREPVEAIELAGPPAGGGPPAPTVGESPAGDLDASGGPTAHVAAGEPAGAQSLGWSGKTIGSEIADRSSAPLGTLVSRPPLFVSAAATLAEAARAMSQAKTSSALVTDDPLGIVTDSDLRRAVAAELAADTPVRSVMSRPLRSLPADAPLDSALLLMFEQDFEHVPVTQGDLIVGLLASKDVLRRQGQTPLQMLDRITELDGLDAVAGYTREIASAVRVLFSGGTDPVRIARVIAGLTDALTRRLLQLAEEELGPPPCPYAWLVLGSEGRMEQALLSDQDNALVFEADSPAANAYFPSLAQRVTNGLLQAGYPACPGGFMATNWCRSLRDWENVLWRWIETPEPQAVLEAHLFLDFRRVHGELHPERLNEILLAGAARRLFLVQMAHSATKFGPPLGLFGRIKARDGQVDIKFGAMTAIVLLARLYGLAARSTARSTLDRLEVAAAAGVLSVGSAEMLADTFRFLMRLRLRDQLGDLAAGRPPDNVVSLNELSSVEQRRLRDAFRAVTDVQKATGRVFNVDG